MEEVLIPLLMQYEPQDVYNADETSLYYKCLLMHLSMKGCLYSQSGQIPTDRITASQITFVFFLFCSTQVRGSKQWNFKDYLSVMFTVNMMGSDKQPPLVIGKAAQPSALKKKNVLLKNLKIEYYNKTTTSYSPSN